MEFLRHARTVRLRGHHGKYLWAEDDRTSISQDRDGSCELALWRVEVVEDNSFEGKCSVIRLQSCFGTYLAASDTPFLLGMTGRKVVQSRPATKDSSVEWEPIRDGPLLKFRTRHGNYLRANGGVPPWRNSVTHDVPSRTATSDWILWEVEIVDTLSEVDASSPKSPDSQPHSFRISSPDSPSETSSRTSFSSHTRSESSSLRLQPKPDGHLIYYTLADDNLEVSESDDWPSFQFKDTSLEKLKSALKEKLEIEEDIIVCSRNPINNKLFPLRIELPPNHSPLHLAVLKVSAPAAKTFM